MTNNAGYRDRFVGIKLIEHGWEIRSLHFDQDISYYVGNTVGLWYCEIVLNPQRRFWQEAQVVEGRGVTTALAIEDAYNNAQKACEESVA